MGSECRVAWDPGSLGLQGLRGLVAEAAAGDSAPRTTPTSTPSSRSSHPVVIQLQYARDMCFTVELTCLEMWNRVCRLGAGEGGVEAKAQGRSKGNNITHTTDGVRTLQRAHTGTTTLETTRNTRTCESLEVATHVNVCECTPGRDFAAPRATHAPNLQSLVKAQVLQRVAEEVGW